MLQILLEATRGAVLNSHPVRKQGNHMWKHGGKVRNKDPRNAARHRCLHNLEMLHSTVGSAARAGNSCLWTALPVSRSAHEWQRQVAEHYGRHEWDKAADKTMRALVCKSSLKSGQARAPAFGHVCQDNDLRLTSWIEIIGDTAVR